MEPGVLLMHAEHLACEVRAWRPAGGGKVKGAGAPGVPPAELLLHEPATARLAFTPALSQFGLSAINPLLDRVADLQGDGCVQVSFAPEGLQVPFTRACVTVEPLQLQMRGGFAGDLVNALGIDSSLASRGGRSWWGLGRRGGALLTARVSRMEAVLDKYGPTQLRRTDMLFGRGAALSGSGRGVHLALWGSLDPGTDALDMTVGLPAASLARLGLQGLPPGYVLPLRLTGTADKPSADIRSTTARLAQLLAWQRQQGLQQKQGAASAAAAVAAAAAQQQQVQGGAAGAGAGEGAAEGGSAGWGQLLSAAEALVLELAGPSPVEVEAAMAADMRSVPAPRWPLPWEMQATEPGPGSTIA